MGVSQVFGRSQHASALSSQERTEDSNVFGQSQLLSLAGRTYISTSFASLVEGSRVSDNSARASAIYQRKWFNDACGGRFTCVCPVGANVLPFITGTGGHFARLWPTEMSRLERASVLSSMGRKKVSQIVGRSEHAFTFSSQERTEVSRFFGWSEFASALSSPSRTKVSRFSRLS